VPQLPLRIRFVLVIAAIAAAVAGAAWVLRGARPEATLWWVASGVLLLTLLVDQAAHLLVFRRLAAIRQAIQHAAAGQSNVRARVDGADEIDLIARGFNDILERLERGNEAVDVRVDAATEMFRQRSAEIADSHREMAMLSDELARAGRLAALGQAAANMAHQIGTPLNLISTHVQLLIQSALPDGEAIDRLRAIQDQIAKVTAIVRAALDSLRPSTAPHQRADLGVLVKRVCQMAGPMLEDAGVEIEVRAPSQSMELLADPVQLEMALLNLVTNSVDAMPTGGRVTLRLERAAERLRLTIEDTGTGIPAELLGRVFDPWVTTKPHGKGSGLGLAIARQVVVSHGGVIRVDDLGGKGAVFTIELPAAPEMPLPTTGGHAEHSHRR
jgi:two-component system NtrC family sensor kinase